MRLTMTLLFALGAFAVAGSFIGILPALVLAATAATVIMIGTFVLIMALGS